MINTKSIRKIGAYLNNPDLVAVRISGADATRFLQSQTTNDINRLESSQSQRSCLLDRKARVVSSFRIYRRQEDYVAIMESSQKDLFLSHLDKFRFADKIEFVELPEASKAIHIEGQLSRLVIKNSLDKTPNSDLFEHDYFSTMINEEKVDVYRTSLYGEEGFLSFGSGDSFKAHLEQVARDRGLSRLEPELLETGRIEAGIIKFNTDYDTNSLLPETGLESSSVSYDKGCFQGQEVLARVRSHGAPTKALVGLCFDAAGKTIPEHNQELSINEETVGWIKSFTHSEFLKSDLAIVLMKRDFREPDKEYQFRSNGEEFHGKVVLLPFYQSPPVASIARELYEKALAVFAEEDENEDSSIQLLRQAISYDPLFEDAYESLGVILSKRDKLDEAIETMLHLVELNADSVMAHTNLSVFYLEKGWKEKAEEEKAISTTIQMLKLARSSKEDSEKEKQKAKRLSEIKERLSMFEEVLEIDSEDFLANYGKGSCLVEMESFKEAVQYLEKALSIKPDHSQAYLELSKAHKALGEMDQYEKVLEEGISVAARRGDMEPLKKMQALIKTGNIG